MEAYHSQFIRTNDIKMCGIVMLPIRTEIQGPAKQIDSQDIIDEALQYFRANIFFKNYTINDPSDVLMIYLTLFIQYSLKLVEKEQKLNDAKKKLLDVSREFVNRPHGQFYEWPCKITKR